MGAHRVISGQRAWGAGAILAAVGGVLGPPVGVFLAAARLLVGAGPGCPGAAVGEPAPRGCGQGRGALHSLHSMHVDTDKCLGQAAPVPPEPTLLLCRLCAQPLGLPALQAASPASEAVVGGHLKWHFVSCL